MKNNFQQWMGEEEENLPPELEFNVIQQVETFSFFGKVVELFIPNALNTVVKMIGGDDSSTNRSGHDSDGGPVWQRPPVKGPKIGL